MMTRLLPLLLLPLWLSAQGTRADYERGAALAERIRDLPIRIPQPATWIDGTSSFWYVRNVKGGHEFVRYDAATLSSAAAFDHARLAALLSSETGEKYTAVSLPFQTVTFVEKEGAMDFAAAGYRWRLNLAALTLNKLTPVAPPRFDTARFRMDDLVAETPVSPDGKWEALVRNSNVHVRAKGAKETVPLSSDGSEGNFYALSSIRWSPDSTKLAAYRIKPGHERKVHYIDSSPADQIQPKLAAQIYTKPGDVLDVLQPVIFDVTQRKQIVIDNSLFPNAFNMPALTWRKDSTAITFEYNQRGHQVYRVVEVNAATGAARALISEEPKTFFHYSGKKFRHDVQDGKEIIWMSERDGWNHLYLFDGVTGKLKNQITKGAWAVRGVEKVDEERRLIWFRAGGMYPGKDPYFNHYYRAGFDGSGLTAITTEDANHNLRFSPDMKYYVDTYSRVDLPPVTELRRTDDRTKLAEVDRADIEALNAAGWRAPQVFTAPGRDGVTGIWGVIFRPSNFDRAKKYKVIEYIYAGPHDSFVPKSFAAHSQMQALAELGFIVVQIDGMGTSNRSKAFHDVAWKNLADAGFPDRILWHKAVAARHPEYDISRVGIYGHSAGGQNAMAALLFHPEFYYAAVASCGCHDNRMDKIWWNEQWMGWPVGPEYAACSNVDNAHKLKGKLLLSVGELDNNVDPASTMQVVNALIKANKTFELIVLPGEKHSNGGTYGERKRNDFFVRQLLGVEPPDWNAQ